MTSKYSFAKVFHETKLIFEELLNKDKLTIVHNNNLMTELHNCENCMTD